MPRLNVLFVLVAAFLAATAFSQTPPTISEDPSAEDSGPFLLLLLAQAEEGASIWRPDWPASFPPDAFAVSTKGVRSIELVMESAEKKDDDAEAATVSARVLWDNKDRLLEFPDARGGAFSQVSVRRSPSGQVIGLVTASASDSAAGKATPVGGKNVVAAKTTAVGFKFSPDGLASSAIVDGEADRLFVSFLFRRWPLELADGNAVETRSLEDGVVVGVFDYAFLQGKFLMLESRSDDVENRTVIRFDYDSFGRVVAIAEPPFEAEALYDGSGRVVYWRFAEDNGTAGGKTRADDKATGGFEERRFQWDERGLLVRELVANSTGQTEIRYEYTLDGRGNWIERRSTRWMERFGSLVGEGGPRSTRRIHYR